MIVHPIRAEIELASGFRDTGAESLLRIGKSERAILGYEGTVDVVDVLSALAVGEKGVKDHDGSAVHDEAHLAPEGVVQPLGEIIERLFEQLARERNVVHVVQIRISAMRCYWHGRHPHGHMHEGHDGSRNRCRCPYGYGLGEGREHHFGAGDEVMGS